ncbi:putative jacalin-type lectin domain-containing protein [Phytophthora infestans]|uniref:Putative jacalin-type lectin domain-containing protein n=1 Tax=Phytophthora infestans TaxID=4787 RepID=A0A833WNZ3_PHYIN|nr:putative jacalin-type lectin domain-containing protein [Phytophthora infestans]KAF4132666.1 putative jacalin-type lectin domain-containing protein [Phytophthora infestans]
MKSISQIFAAAVVIVAGCTTALQDGIRLGETFGGPHGDKFSDLNRVSPGQTVESITIRSADRIDAVSLVVVDPWGVKDNLAHGGGGGDPNTLTLGADEHIIGGNTISGGTPTDNIGKEVAPDGYQLGGLVGYSDKEVDSLGPIWTIIEPVESEGPYYQRDGK